MRRYSAMPNLKKAELVEAVVFVPSPFVRADTHGAPHACVVAWLGHYASGISRASVADSATVCVDLDNVVQPDAYLMIESAAGGQARVDEDGYIEGSPELVAEIAATSASIDLNVKLHVYRRNKVREYLVWRTLDAEFDWFILRESEFQRLLPGPDGLFRSEIYPGLWLDPAALLRGEMATVLKRLQEGLATPEHAAFANRLKATGTP